MKRALHRQRPKMNTLRFTKGIVEGTALAHP
jgi:hypothetical protein